jgi:hypothetical protein
MTTVAQECINRGLRKPLDKVGTPRSRVSFFMNRFRKLGFIKYNGELEIHSSLLNVVLRDSPDNSA